LRIVSLCPSLTELVFALGLGDRLVGRTKFCVQPAGLVEGIEKVGGTKNPKIDRVVQLAPDLVLMNEEENRIEDAEALRAAGIACHTSMPRNVAETIESIRSIGEALGVPERAEAIAHDIAARTARVRESVAGQTLARYAYLIWRNPYMAVSGDTYVSNLIAEAGGENVFADRTDRYPQISAEELGEADPHLVLLSSEPFPFTERHIDELVELTSLPRDRFVLVDGELLSWHGPRTGEGVQYAREVLSRNA
jgi:ABC-type Fe3+-hydroxamate transport system substrate-binding protein